MISLLATVLVFQAISGNPPTAAPTAAGAERRVVVALASGRRLAGEIDLKTDNEHLWLRGSRAGITLLRPIAWDCVVSVDLPDERVQGAELLSAVKILAAELARETTPAGP